MFLFDKSIKFGDLYYFICIVILNFFVIFLDIYIKFKSFVNLFFFSKNKIFCQVLVEGIGVEYDKSLLYEIFK